MFRVNPRDPLTDASCDDTHEQKYDGDIRFRRRASGEVLKEHSAVGPVNGRAVREERLVVAAQEGVAVPLALAPQALHIGPREMP